MTRSWIVERVPDADSESLGAVYDLYTDTDPVLPVCRIVDTLAKYDPATETASDDGQPVVRLIAQVPVMLGIIQKLAARKRDVGYLTDGLIDDVCEARALLARLSPLGSVR